VAIIGGEERQAAGTRPRRVELPAAEVVVGDRVRDEGTLKRVAAVVPLVSVNALLLFFDPAEGYRDDVSVPVLQSVSVWRVCGAW
jgi:hypothetical protein